MSDNSAEPEGSEGGSGVAVGVLDVVLLVVFLVVVMLIVRRFWRKRAERNKLKDLKINTTCVYYLPFSHGVINRDSVVLITHA